VNEVQLEEGFGKKKSIGSEDQLETGRKKSRGKRKGEREKTRNE
jgi:hypothetical protein